LRCKNLTHLHHISRVQESNEAPPQTDEACGDCGSEAEPR